MSVDETDTTDSIDDMCATDDKHDIDVLSTVNDAKLNTNEVLDINKDMHFLVDGFDETALTTPVAPSNLDKSRGCV